MASIIHKHSLGSSCIFPDTQQVSLVAGAQILHIGIQHGQICFWEKHNAEAWASETRRFMLVGTGMEFWHPKGYRLVYIGSTVSEFV